MTIQEFEKSLRKYNISLYYSKLDIVSSTPLRVMYYRFIYSDCEFFIQANRSYLDDQFFKNIFTKSHNCSFVFKNIDLFNRCKWIDESIVHFINEYLFLDILKNEA